jgi:hypothetical protein
LCNGYKFGSLKNIYNTWSTVNYFNDISSASESIREEWTKSGGFDLVSDIILKNKDDVISSLNDLISGKSIAIKYEEIDYEKLVSGEKNTFLNVLLMTGYLTAEVEEKVLSVKIPNKAVDEAIKEQIVKWSNKIIPSNKSEDIFNYLFDGKIDEFQASLNEGFKNASFFDINSEKDGHNIMSGMMMVLDNSRFDFSSNKEAGSGRYDHKLHDKKNKIGYIFEYKYLNTKSDKRKIDTALIDALSQIDNQNYSSAFDGVDTIAINKVAVVFYGKEVHVSFKQSKPKKNLTTK